MPQPMLEPQPRLEPQPKLMLEPVLQLRLELLPMPMHQLMLMPMPKLVPLLELKLRLMLILIIEMLHQPTLRLELPILLKVDFLLIVVPQLLDLLQLAMGPVGQLEWPGHLQEELPVLQHLRLRKAFDLSEAEEVIQRSTLSSIILPLLLKFQIGLGCGHLFVDLICS